MKRFLSILLSVLMVVSVLAIVASCSGNKTDTTTAATQVDTTAQTTTAKQDDTTKQTDVVTTVTEKVTTTAETTTEKTTTTAETTTETTKQTTAETTTEETTTTAEETTTTAAATTTAKPVETTTLPVFARFDFGTRTYAEDEGLTSHDYLTEVLIYDDSALMINFEDDCWDIWTVSPYDSESVTFENGSLKNMRFGVVFNDLVTFDFDDDIVHGWGSWERYPYAEPTEKTAWHGTHQYMQVRMVNDTTNNIWGIRYINTGDGTYYTTEVIGNLYLQGGEPESATDYRRTCEKSKEWRVYTYDLMMVGGIASGRGWSAVSGKDGKIDDGVDNYYVVGLGRSGNHAWNIVKIDGKFYNYDTTWNDVTFNYNQYVARGSDFFNSNHTAFTRSHAGSMLNMYQLPAISELDYYYDPVYRKITANYTKKLSNVRQIKADYTSTTLMWKVPYNAYYMSCNLDHVLYNKQNSNDKDKENDAVKFALHYRESIPDFIDFISKSDFSYKMKPELSLTDNHRESWKEIRLDSNSLERRTNFGLAFV